MSNFASPWYASDHVDPQQVQEDYYLDRALYDKRRAEQDRVNRSQERSMEYRERKHRHHHHHHHHSSRRPHRQEQPASTAPAETARPPQPAVHSVPLGVSSTEGRRDGERVAPALPKPIWWPSAQQPVVDKPLPALPQKSNFSEYRTPQQRLGPNASDYLQVPQQSHRSRRHRSPEDAAPPSTARTDKTATKVPSGPSKPPVPSRLVTRYTKITPDSSSLERVSKFHEGAVTTAQGTEPKLETIQEVSSPTAAADSKQKSYKLDKVSTSISKSIEKGRKRVANGIKESVTNITAAIRERNFDVRQMRRQTPAERQQRALFSYSDATFTCNGLQGDESNYRCLVCGVKANPALIHGYCMDCIEVVRRKEAAAKAAKEAEQVRAAISGMLKLDTDDEDSDTNVEILPALVYSDDSGSDDVNPFEDPIWLRQPPPTPLKLGSTATQYIKVSPHRKLRAVRRTIYEDPGNPFKHLTIDTNCQERPRYQSIPVPLQSTGFAGLIDAASGMYLRNEFDELSQSKCLRPGQRALTDARTALVEPDSPAYWSAISPYFRDEGGGGTEQVTELPTWGPYCADTMAKAHELPA